MKRIYFFLVLVLFYITGNAQTVTTFTLNSGVTSTTLIASMAFTDSIVLKKGSLPAGYKIKATSYYMPTYNYCNVFIFAPYTNYNWNNDLFFFTTVTSGSIFINSTMITEIDLTGCDSLGGDTMHWKIINGSIPTGLLEYNYSNNEIKIFPNPIKDELNFNFTNNIPNEFKVNIYNCNGQLELSENYLRTAPFPPLNTQKLNKGMYLIEILFDDKRSIRKIVKD